VLWIAEVANHERILSAATTTATGYGSLSLIKRGPPAAVNNPAHPSPLFWPQYAPTPRQEGTAAQATPHAQGGAPFGGGEKGRCGSCPRSERATAEVAAEAVSLRARFQLAEARGDPHFGRAAEPGKAWALSKHHELGLTHRRWRAAFLQNLRLPAIRLA
jgi:hypothetical protein